LKLEVLVGRDEDIEPAVRRALKQHGANLMPHEVACQVTRQLLILWFLRPRQLSEGFDRAR